MNRVLNANNIMVDLETMGQNSNSAIIAIGAVRFSETIQDSFYEIVDLQSSVDAGLEIDPSTIMWWMKQSDEARGAFAREGSSLIVALSDFSLWAGNHPIIWGNGADFDNVILANAYRAFSLKPPWAFWDSRCYRTLKNLNRHIKMERSGTAHNALDDARTQAIHAIEILESQ